MIFLIAATALFACTALYAHHSYGATYDVSKQLKLEGKIVQFVFRNPHSFVHVQAADEKGVPQRWAVAISGHRGWSEASVAIGDPAGAAVQPLSSAAKRPCGGCGTPRLLRLNRSKVASKRCIAHRSDVEPQPVEATL